MRARLVFVGICLLLGCGAVAGLETPTFLEEPVEAGPPDVYVEPPPFDAGNSFDAGPIGPECGDAACLGDTPRCCVGAIPRCAAGSDPCQPSVDCDGPEDCDSGVCCLRTGLFGQDTGGRCIALDAGCTGVSAGFACHDKSECPVGKDCREFGLVLFQKSPYHACQ